jgi:hypothetical protein
MDRTGGSGAGDPRGVPDGLHQPLLQARAQACGQGHEEGGQQRAGTMEIGTRHTKVGTKKCQEYHLNRQ